MLGVRIVVACLVAGLLFTGGFFLGSAISADYENINLPADTEIISPGIIEDPSEIIFRQLGQVPESKPSPQDRIKESDFKVRGNTLEVDVGGEFIIARFTDTRSMESIITSDANAIERKVDDIDEVEVGDIISYDSPFVDGIIIHRVVEKGKDEKGPYLRTKGDNLDYIDPIKIREVNAVVVGIWY
ncbi:hypothetical protein GOV09_03325 [Candidatus Woesearchaeota archaeon]|nr:hypothetical protein [Candidatus Woesearchaeota archaeon]